MELKIYFSEQEMLEMLKDIGYQSEVIDSFFPRPEYHNNVAFVDIDLTIVYKERPNIGKTRNDFYTLEKEYGVEATFLREMKERMKYLFKNR